MFLDRDGVLIQNRADYVRSWEEAELLPRSIQALAKARDTEYKFILVTNQSGVGRGMITLDMAESINRQLVLEIHKAGGRLDGVYMCVHSPDQECACRKPKPGLLLAAEGQLGIDLERSILIGDALSDLEAGKAAGVGKVAMVRTGRGTEQSQTLEDQSAVFNDLDEGKDTDLLPIIGPIRSNTP